MMVISGPPDVTHNSQGMGTGHNGAAHLNPVKGHELILGKLLPYFIIGMTDVGIAVIMGEFLFHVPMRGSLLMSLHVRCLSCRSLLPWNPDRIIAKPVPCQPGCDDNDFSAILPSSGFMSAISNMPKPLQIATHVIPARYLSQYSREYT